MRRHIVVGTLSLLLGCGASDSTAPNPLPRILQLSPDYVEVGSGNVNLLVVGTGFVASSTVQVNGEGRPTTFETDKALWIQLVESDLVLVRDLAITVSTPRPGGGVSNASVLDVRPQSNPFVAQASPSVVETGQDSATIRVEGARFESSSKVQLDGVNRPTIFLSETFLSVTLPAEDLREAGTHVLTVVTPGRKPSNALPIQFVNAQPSLVFIPVQGAHVGPGFKLAVHGSRFVRTSVVHWNGSGRPTQFISHKLLTVQILESDLTPGVGLLSVVNPPPGGGPSAHVAMTVRPVPTGTLDLRMVALSARDMALDTLRRRIYVSIPGNAANDPNAVLSVDPVSMTVTNRAFVGSDPNVLAISDDGSFLYAGLNGASAVRRVRLQTFTAELQWSLPPLDRKATDMVVLSGRPSSVAVAMEINSQSVRTGDRVSVYDDGTPRNDHFEDAFVPAFLQRHEHPDTLYGYGSGLLRVFEIRASGLRQVRVAQLTQLDSRAIATPGRVYGYAGTVVDPGRLERIDSLGFNATAMAIDTRLGRAFIIGSDDFFAELAMHVIDLNTGRKLATFSAFGRQLAGGVHYRLLRWSTDELVFLAGGTLYVMKSQAFGPA